MKINPAYEINKLLRKAKAYYAKKKHDGTITGEKYFRVGTAFIIFIAVFAIGKTSGAATSQPKKIQGTTARKDAQEQTQNAEPYTQRGVQENSPIKKRPPFRIPDSPKIASISAQAYYVINAENSKILAEKNPENPLPPASTTKIATALVSMENYLLNQKLRVPEVCTNLDARRIGYPAGQEVIVEELLYNLLTESAADAACTLAENFNGGRPEFINQINILVKNLDLENTRFTNPTGFDNVNGEHYSTAKDLTLLAKEAMKSGIFRKIVGTRTENTNELFSRIPGTTGIKTGWTEQAKGCLVFSVERKGYEIIGTLLGSDDRFADAETIINWVYQVYEWEK